jgi:hypothetical protein
MHCCCRSRFFFFVFSCALALTLSQAKSTNTKLFPFFHVHYEQILSDSSLDIADLYMKWLKVHSTDVVITAF